jgi:uncharacterized protein
MSQRIPDRLDPWRFADQGREVEGSIPLESMPRLSACLLDVAGEAGFSLRFERDAQRRATLKGTIRADLILECQRCLEAMKLPVSTGTAVAFVEGQDQAAQLPESLDPCLVEEGQVHFRDLIEDELLLALPQVAMHDLAVCPAASPESADEKPAEQGEQQDKNPFAVLAELKRDKN